MPKFQSTDSSGSSKAWINATATNYFYCLPVLIAIPDFGPLSYGMMAAVNDANAHLVRCDRT
jgi:hypothetical protein